MNEFDQFVKHSLRIKYYARYTDDFVIVSEDSRYLEHLLPPIQAFLQEKFLLTLHPHKIEIRKVIRGIDFLGYVTLPHHLVVRTKTKQRMFKKLRQKIRLCKRGLISRETLEATLKSYLGVFSHANARRLTEQLKNQFWFWLGE